jgi:hypothetical protein
MSRRRPVYHPVRSMVAAAILRAVLRVAWWLLVLAAVAALWPLVIVSAVASAAAWSLGLPARRLYRAALWSLTMTGVYILAAALQTHGWQDIVLRPVHDWITASRHLAHGAVLSAAFGVAPVAVPAGLAIGAAWWAHRWQAMSHGLAGRSAYAPVVFAARQWRRAAARAKWITAAPGAVPLTARGGGVPVGGVIRAIRRPARDVLVIPAAEFGRHMVIVGATGSGKTNLMMRLWAGWMAAAIAGGPRPLLIIIDCKGGPDAREKARRTKRLLRSVSATVRVRTWPDEDPVSLWALPPAQLAVLLHQLIESGEGSAAYYADVSAAVIRLAVCAPAGPPASARELLDRLEPAWLEQAYAEGLPGELARIRAARAHLGDIQLRYATLMERLGPGFDGPGNLTDADAWYFVLEGTAEASVAEAQAMAITELVAHAATASGQRRKIMLAADDYSAVSRRVSLSSLYERGRSLGLGLMVSAQSWEGLGRDEDERRRITRTADGGLWVMRTPGPEELIAHAGTTRTLESARKLLGPAFGEEGSSRLQHQWMVDPDLIRQLETGQACYIHRGTAVYVQVARPRPSPVPLPAARRPAPSATVPAQNPRRSPPPDGGDDRHQDQPARLDDVLGPGAAA